MIHRGDVVLVRIPYIEVAGQGKRRPAVVVQSDGHNTRLPHTIVAAVTSKVRIPIDPVCYLLDPADSEGQAAGVLTKSLVRCDRLFTVDRQSIERTIGRLAPGSLDRVEDCLRAALGLPPQAEPAFGNYEKWPGFLRVRERLEMLCRVMNLPNSDHAFVAVDVQQSPSEPIVRLWGHRPKLLAPTNKEEFIEAGHSVRLSLELHDERDVGKVSSLAPTDLVKYPMHRVVLWTHSGPSNQILSAYIAEALNEGSTEVYILSMGEGGVEFGFSASGNVFDSLLLNDRLRNADAPDAPRRENS